MKKIFAQQDKALMRNLESQTSVFPSAGADVHLGQASLQKALKQLAIL